MTTSCCFCCVEVLKAKSDVGHLVFVTTSCCFYYVEMLELTVMCDNILVFLLCGNDRTVIWDNIMLFLLCGSVRANCDMGQYHAVSVVWKCKS